MFKNQLARNMIQLKSSSRPIRSISFSPDGKLLASIGFDDMIRIWNTSNWKIQTKWKAKDQRFSSLVFTPDSASIITVRSNNQPIIWDVATGRTSGRAFGDDVADTISSDEVLLAIGRLLVVYSTTLRRVRQFTRLPEWSERSRNYAREQHTASFLADNATPNDDPVRSQFISPDATLVGTTLRDGTVCVWDPATRNEICSLGAPAPVMIATHPAQSDFWIQTVAFQPSGRSAVTASPLTLRSWDLETRTEIAIRRFKGKWLQTIAFTPDGRHLLVGGNDQIIRSLDPERLTDSTEFNWKIGEVQAIAVSPNGLTAAASGRKAVIVVWDLED